MQVSEGGLQSSVDNYLDLEVSRYSQFPCRRAVTVTTRCQMRRHQPISGQLQPSGEWSSGSSRAENEESFFE